MKKLPNSATRSSPRRSPAGVALRKIGRFGRRLLHAATDQHGDGLVETAVVLPVFLMIFFGIAQYAIVLLTYCNATYACRVASRYASMHSLSSLAPDTVPQIQGIVTSRLFLNPSITPVVSMNCYSMTLTPVSCNVGNNIGYVVQVSVTWTQTLKLLPSNINTFSVSTQNVKVITR